MFTGAQVTNTYLGLSNLTVSDLQMLKSMYEPINLAIIKKKAEVKLGFYYFTESDH